jgi:two-component system alkaline phosphatase synthesis response regulator PhoP
MKKLILLVEDEPDIVRLLTHFLEKDGFEVAASPTGPHGLATIRRRKPAAVILDLMLPDLDGYEICRRVRSDPATAPVPIIMLTAKGDETARVVGLELGADDYVTKPFSPKELLARLRALLRRAAPPIAPAEQRMTYRDVVLDVSRHEVTVGTRPVELTAKEFELLRYFLRHPGLVATRDALLESVWGESTYVGSRTVDVHIRRLREKIPLLATAIKTIKPIGYKLHDATHSDEP